MESQNKLAQRPIFRRDANWEPFPNWTTDPSRIFSQDLGLPLEKSIPPFLDPGDIDWLEWAKKRLDSHSHSWPTKGGPLLSNFSGQHLALDQGELKQLTGGAYEVMLGPDGWKVELDVKHFSPQEITVSAKEGYLLISGKHEERKDEQGSVSRCFTRKYKLPLGLDLQQISSSLSPDGLLTVEAPAAVSGTTTEGATELVIPIQTQHIKDKR